MRLRQDASNPRWATYFLDYLVVALLGPQTGGLHNEARLLARGLPRRGYRSPDDTSVSEPPDPLPNSAVKRLSADGSVGSPHVRVGRRQALILKPRLWRGFFVGGP